MALGPRSALAAGWLSEIMSMNDVTHILSAIEHGDATAPERLLPLVYESCASWLQRLAHESPARRSRPRHWFTRPIFA